MKMYPKVNTEVSGQGMKNTACYLSLKITSKLPMGFQDLIQPEEIEKKVLM